ncbi:MAG TPA: hypothetical protein VFL59_09745, partial [Candidatus Nanopelagicales bacterium]|nr:hypothetical protein [Candidatus Nanopelagicales bacterium]
MSPAVLGLLAALAVLALPGRRRRLRPPTASRRPAERQVAGVRSRALAAAVVSTGAGVVVGGAAGVVAAAAAG